MHDFTSSDTCNQDVLQGSSLADVCSASSFYLFMTLLNTLIRSNEKISGLNERVKEIENPDDEYDFVVVGGGAAGAVVAARLSEIPSWKVLLLEAGPDEPAAAGIPAYATHYLNTKDIWNYKTTNESHGCQGTNNSCAWPQGKNLGGCTTHNWMLYLRGHPTDYNQWAAQGCEGWTWEEVKPFYIKSEDNAEIDRVGTDHHGTGGPLSVGRFPYMPPFGDAILAAAEEAGYPISEDLNGDVFAGFARIQGTHKNGVRSSSASAFLRPIRNRKNLHVSLNSHVTKVLFKKKRAIAVDYFKDRELRRVYASREIILSGGVVESPHLLLLSGIGPKKHLKSFNIKVIKDSPGVGENLQDHPGALVPFTVNEDDIYDNNWKIAAEYAADITGPLSSIGTVQTLGVIASNATTPDHPDLEIYFKGWVPECAPGDVGALQSTGKRIVYMLPSLLHPKSRGRITLTSTDPFEHPAIWANFLSDPYDVDRMLDGFKIIMSLLETDSFRAYNVTVADGLLHQACLHHELLSDDYWMCVMRQDNYALYHQVGTCKMGPSSDSMAVVDPRLRVHGIEGLRVADASIMPLVPSCNTAPPSMMIGERAAHFIKEDWISDFNRQG